MKVRTNFVSNSSSTSFVLIGKVIDNWEELEKQDCEDSIIYSSYHEWAFKVKDLDSEYFKFIQDRWKNEYGIMVKSLMFQTYNSGDELKEDLLLPKGSTIIYGELDENYPETIEEFIKFCEYKE